MRLRKSVAIRCGNGGLMAFDGKVALQILERIGN